MMGVRFQGGRAVAECAARGTGAARRWTAATPAVAVAMLVLVGVAPTASALILTGGPVYSLPGGGSCTVSGVTGSTGGATISCTGVNLGPPHTHVYFGIKNNSDANGISMVGNSPPTGLEIFRFSSTMGSSITYSSTTTINDLLHGPLTVSSQLVLTLTAGSASVVSAGGNPANNAMGDVQQLFEITGGNSFTIRADVLASNSQFPLGYALSGLYDPTHTSGNQAVSKVDVGFYYSDCGDGNVDSPEQCDQGLDNGASTSCCTTSCTFRAGGQVCRPGAGAPGPGELVACDASETCTGTGATCPPDDAPTKMGTPCRAGSGDICDQNELCTGVPGQGCPPDDAPNNTTIVCRASSVGDFCDQPEYCNGVPGATCPSDDAPTLVNVVCRAGSGDLCDPDEKCSGVPGSGCPANVVANPSTICRLGSGDVCDPTEFCTAVAGQPCPADVVQPGSTVCRAAAGICDVAESCTGAAGQTCPPDGKAPASTPCNDDNDVCTIDACDGSGACVFDSALDCSDNNSCTQDSCDPQDGCQYSGAPSNSCTTATKAVIKIRDSASDSSDSVRFVWKGGPSLVPDMGDPTQTTRYELCIYDSRGVQMAMGVPPGSGWSPLGPTIQPKGYKYKDSSAQSDGVKLIKTKGSNLDRGQVKVIGKGAALPDTADLPLQYPITAQVYASDGMCWDAQFSMLQTKKNDSGKFAAKLP